jgi:hypothetical protein
MNLSLINLFFAFYVSMAINRNSTLVNPAIVFGAALKVNIMDRLFELNHPTKCNEHK